MNEEIITINITMERYLAMMKIIEAIKDSLTDYQYYGINEKFNMRMVRLYNLISELNDME